MVTCISKQLQIQPPPRAGVCWGPDLTRANPDLKATLSCLNTGSGALVLPETGGTVQH